MGLFIIEGMKVIDMALESTYEVPKLFVDDDKLDIYKDVIEKAIVRDAQIISVSSQASLKLSFGKTTQGIFATVNIPKYDMSKVIGPLVVACEDLSDPGNMGTIIRTADAVGVTSIIISPQCVDIYNDKVIRASMGSLFNVNTIISRNFSEDVICLREKGYNIACGHLEGEDFFSRKKHDKNVLIIGNESRGISAETESLCQSKWKLPMHGKAESLNAAVAAGIMMYDITRNN